MRERGSVCVCAVKRQRENDQSTCSCEFICGCVRECARVCATLRASKPLEGRRFGSEEENS